WVGVPLVVVVAGGVTALSGAVCGELAGDAESCRLWGARTAGEGGEAIVEGVVALIAGEDGEAIVEGVAALIAGEGGEAIGETIVVSAVLMLRGTLAITGLPSPSWPALCTTTPLALAVDPHPSAAEAAASGRDRGIGPPRSNRLCRPTP